MDQAKQATNGHPKKLDLAKITNSGKGRLVKRLAPPTPALFQGWKAQSLTKC